MQYRVKWFVTSLLITFGLEVIGYRISVLTHGFETYAWVSLCGAAGLVAGVVVGRLSLRHLWLTPTVAAVLATLWFGKTFTGGDFANISTSSWLGYVLCAALASAGAFAGARISQRGATSKSRRLPLEFWVMLLFAVMVMGATLFIAGFFEGNDGRIVVFSMLIGTPIAAVVTQGCFHREVAEMLPAGALPIAILITVSDMDYDGIGDVLGTLIGAFLVLLLAFLFLATGVAKLIAKRFPSWLEPEISSGAGRAVVVSDD